MKHNRISFIFFILILIMSVFVSCGEPQEAKDRLSEDRDISQEMPSLI